MTLRKVLVVMSLFSICSIALPASAHTTLESSNPAANSIVETLPESVTLIFGEKLITLGDANSITVIDEAGKDLINGKPEISGATITSKLVASQSVGVIKVNYRVVAADGHVLTDSYQFTVAPGSSAISASETPSTITPVANSENKISIYLIISATLVIGGGLLLFFIWKRQQK
jgi:hypothetical protein